MIPVLFPHDTSTFITHGIGDLMETIQCEAVVNSEGEYELELQYPADGQLIGSLAINNIIVAKVNDHGTKQAFRIYGIDKEINSLVTVRAQHISYDLSCVVVKNFSTNVCRLAMLGLKTNAIGDLATPFGFMTDIPDTERPLNQDREFKMEEPLTLRAALLDGDDSIYGCWEGDLVFDNYTVKFLKPGSTDADAGKDRGTLIEYGIDLIDMKQEENISEMITGVYPYWKGREEGEETDEDKIVYGDIQYAAGTFTRHRVVPLNVTDYYPNNTTAPSVAEINQTARDWMAANKVGEPVINLTLSYAELGKDVRLYDAVTVRFVKIGIDVKAKVISYRYDVLKERCIEVEVGSVKPSFLFSLEDASRLKRGLIPPKRIANNSINSDMIQNYGIDSNNLGTGAVTEKKIADEAVTENKISDLAVTEYKLGPLSVTEGKLAEGSVTNGKIGPVAVTGDKIRDLAVSTAKLGNFAVTTGKIAEAAVTNYAVYKGNDQLLRIDGQNLKDLSVDTLQIGDSAITSTKIGSSAVTNQAIYNGSNQLLRIDGKNLKDASINTLQIGSSAITSVKIANGAVINEKVYSGTNQLLRIDGHNLKDLSVDTLQIGSSAITSTKIGSSAVTNHAVYNGANQLLRIDGKNLKDLSVDTLQIGSSAITSTKIGAGEVLTGNIGNQAIDFRTVKNAEIDQLLLNDYSVTNTKISDPGWRYHWQRNPDGTVTKGWVQDEEAVNSDNIYSGAVISEKIGEQEIKTTHFDEDLNQWIVDVDAAVKVVVNTLAWSEAEGGYLAVNHLLAGGFWNYFEVTAAGTSLGSNVSIWGSAIGSAVVQDEFGNNVSVLTISEQ